MRIPRGTIDARGRQPLSRPGRVEPLRARVPALVLGQTCPRPRHLRRSPRKTKRSATDIADLRKALCGNDIAHFIDRMTQLTQQPARRLHPMPTGEGVTAEREER